MFFVTFTRFRCSIEKFAFILTKKMNKTLKRIKSQSAKKIEPEQTFAAKKNKNHHDLYKNLKYVQSFNNKLIFENYFQI